MRGECGRIGWRFAWLTWLLCRCRDEYQRPINSNLIGGRNKVFSQEGEAEDGDSKGGEDYSRGIEAIGMRGGWSVGRRVECDGSVSCALHGGGAIRAELGTLVGAVGTFP